MQAAYWNNKFWLEQLDNTEFFKNKKNYLFKIMFNGFLKQGHELDYLMFKKHQVWHVWF